MDEQYIKQRIAKLRTEKGISAREMSLQLGQSTGYINSIENGKSLPSIGMLLSICEFLEISPSDFFNEDFRNTAKVDDVAKSLKKLDKGSFEIIMALVERLKKLNL